MTRSGWVIASLLALPLALGCSHGQSPTDARETLVVATFGAEFDLPAGGRAELDGGALVVEFTGVREDSRCPADVTCVWAGDGAVELRLTPDGGAAGTVVLHTALEPRETDHAGYRVRLVRLSPYPDSRAPIAPGDYVATLVVTRAPD